MMSDDCGPRPLHPTKQMRKKILSFLETERIKNNSTYP